MGEYNEDECPVSENPEDWEESFFQSDVLVCDMEIKDVVIQDMEP